MAGRRPRGSLEAEVLATLWAADGALTAAEVAEGLGADLAYNTVQTILTRLHAKGAVRRELSGRAHVYTPVLDDAGMTAERMHAMLEQGSDHAAVLARFLHTLTAQDEATLKSLIKGPDTAE